mmetsp:Transcript_12736/g.48836  ORF Transcript_12736/g.48836 Transcript_12736/m.48836 type:complete len:231 (+) Transcript_12736:268-960(+)
MQGHRALVRACKAQQRRASWHHPRRSHRGTARPGGGPLNAGVGAYSSCPASRLPRPRAVAAVRAEAEGRARPGRLGCAAFKWGSDRPGAARRGRRHRIRRGSDVCWRRRVGVLRLRAGRPRPRSSGRGRVPRPRHHHSAGGSERVWQDHDAWRNGRNGASQFGPCQRQRGGRGVAGRPALRWLLPSGRVPCARPVWAAPAQALCGSPGQASGRPCRRCCGGGLPGRAHGR